ncbi:hypothetical protein [Nocardiopsis trehalosi]|uniref:hypothetical protein n=1 Tax=Nocardiopsis trehalosi TaxID=109329 RepID=UPI000B11E7D9|nr:hypothetical protein [Nocardiopsis trehalosi]
MTVPGTGAAAERPVLRVAARVELVSLVVLLGNLATAHVPEVASLAGPLHGCAYLVAVVAAVRDPRRSPATTVLALVPGVGGLLALRRLRTADARAGAPAA